MKSPPPWKIKKLFKSNLTLHKISETVIDDEYGQTEESEETFSIVGEIQVITLEDMVFLPAGEVSSGDAFGYFLPSYLLDGIEYTVEVNDYISFKGIKYLVTRVEPQFEGNTEVFRRAYLKRQVGQ